MRIVPLDQFDGRLVKDFSSQGFRIAALGLLRPGQALAVTLEPGGRIGRHPAVGAQALIPLLGSAAVSGGDGVPAPVAPGEIVLWEAGEDHETTTADGLTALVLEGTWERGPL